jgi:ABC-2 type transport system ATP-binding protein
MASLTERFREIEVTLERDAKPPATLPGTWIRSSTAGPVFRFVETQFDRERTPAEIRNVLGEPRNISVSAMPLRSIFVTMARNAAKDS